MPQDNSITDRRIAAYLERIGYTGPLDGSANVLAALQQCHLRAVPYENFDILHGVPLSLELDPLYDKIVVRRRGGYCFETNALFAWLLRQLGYEVTDLVARFWRGETKQPPKRRHHVLAVTAEGNRYLCDVGVGGIVPLRPVRIVPMLEQQQGEEAYRLEQTDDFGWMLSERKGDDWQHIYSFTEEPQWPGDFTFASYWCEHAPDSVFRQGAIVAIRTPEGRNTVSGEEFRVFAGPDVRTFVPATADEYAAALHTYFYIVLSSDELARRVRT